MLYNQHNLNVAKIASKSEMKPALASVMFKKDRTVATDGFRLLEVTVPADVKPEEFPAVDGKSAMRGCEPFLVPAKSVREIKLLKNKNLPMLENMAIKHIDGKHIEFMTTDLSASQIKSVNRIDDKFPEYEQIFPTGKPEAVLFVNAKLLGEMLSIMGELNEQITFKIYGSEKPAVMECGISNQKARALIMPIRM